MAGDDRVSERGQVWLATGHTGMRKGFGSLARIVQGGSGAIGRGTGFS